MSDLVVFGFWTKKLVAALMLLPCGPLLAIACGLWLARRRRRFGHALIATGLVVLVAFSLPIVANAIGRASESDFPPLGPDVPLPPNTAIVVLGGGVQQGATDYGGETVNAVTLVRLRSAARLAARTGLPVLVSGGTLPGNRASEGDEMAASMDRDFHTPVRWIEKQSIDTPDNARLSVPILAGAGIRTAILVTDVDHMQRARRSFEAAGMPVIPAPTDYYANAPLTLLSFVPNTGALRRSAWSIHERAGLLWQRLRG